MIKNFLFIIVFLFIANCSLNKVERTHGTPFLEKKEKILIVNNTFDKVVSSDNINEIHTRLKNSKMIIFNSTKHEIFMEKDIHREKLWNSIDQFLNEK